MRNRWFHRPRLHSPALGLEKKASWLELFFDLIFVAAFIQLGNGLSGHVTPGGFLSFAGMFVPLWLAWVGFTFYENRFTVDDFLHRTLVFVQMFAIGGMAISAPLVLDGHIRAFSLSAGIAQGMVGVMYLRAYYQVPEARDYSRYWGTVFGVSGLAWIGAFWLLPAAVPIVWAVMSLVVLGAPLSKRSRALNERFRSDWEHLGERFALLTLIVLGESFVKVLGELARNQAGVALYLEAGVVLLITCGIWWVYFDDVAGARIKKGPAKWIIWLYAHLPLQISVIAVGVALKKAVHFGWNEPAPSGYRWLLAGSLALTYFSVSMVDSVTDRRHAHLSDRARVNARWISGIVLLVLAPAGRTMSGGLFLTLVTAINVAQVVFDMMMAPFVEDEHAEAKMESTSDYAKRVLAGEKTTRRRNVFESVRKGTPSELRKDLYFYFIEGSWLRVFVSIGFLFLISNVFFAGLYTLDPGSINNANPSSFVDAFAFSVQTMSTIGYGALSPATDYGHAIVTIEAALSIIGVAVVTGLVFAKVSRPSSGVLFSEPIIKTTMNGKPVLAFRVGNARGSEIVDATMMFTVVMEAFSPEGHHLRRLHDLKLVRARSPMFALSWLVMHEIDEDSPLAEVDWDDPREVVVFVATMTGHDGTYGQTMFARHVWQPDDVVHDARFVDVISELEDGRMMIDYTRFHDIIMER